MRTRQVAAVTMSLPAIAELSDAPVCGQLPRGQRRATRRLAGDAASWRERVRDVYASRAAISPPRYHDRRIFARLQHIIAPSSRVLEVGCASGHLLAAVKPAYGLGVDLVERHIVEAQKLYPCLDFFHAAIEDLPAPEEKFDYIVLSQVLGEIYDVVGLLRKLLDFAHDRTRLVIVNPSRLWQPAWRLAEWIGLKPQAPPQNWLPTGELINLLELAGWESIRRTGLTIAPLRLPLVSDWINRYVGNLPLVEALGLHHVHVARPVAANVRRRRPPASVSIVIPARNEAGHIAALLGRIPTLAPRQEIIFVEGHSTDDTWSVIERSVAEYRGPWSVRALRQTGKGKANAVREGFAVATGEVLFILDADISVPPEELTLFRDAIAGGQAEFVNGSRMVYLMDKQAMRFLNLLGNKAFGMIFTYLLAQRFRDTLCGTKVLRRSDYVRLAEQRGYFGDFDPFGDFDLLFGAARLGLKIMDVPVHYQARTYGETNISRFRHGWMLLRMCAFAAGKLRFI